MGARLSRPGAHFLPPLELARGVSRKGEPPGRDRPAVLSSRKLPVVRRPLSAPGPPHPGSSRSSGGSFRSRAPSFREVAGRPAALSAPGPLIPEVPGHPAAPSALGPPRSGKLPVFRRPLSAPGPPHPGSSRSSGGSFRSRAPSFREVAGRPAALIRSRGPPAREVAGQPAAICAFGPAGRVRSPGHREPGQLPLNPSDVLARWRGRKSGPSS
jgi:hypothetical protein